MKPACYLHFSSFCLDRIGEQLWQGTQLLPLRRKALAVLRYLVEHAGEMVTKDSLLDTIWPDVQVSEGVLTVHMREVRKVLGDDAQSPQFIETVHGRGYRFIGKVVSSQYPVASGRKSAARSHQQLTTDNWQLITHLVGRETELAQLHRWLEKALYGERQIVFVTGEPGIGKTTVVEAFLKSLASSVPRLVSEQVQSPKSKVEFLHQSPTPGLVGGSALNSTGRVKPICRFLQLWAGCVENRAGSVLLSFFVNTPPRGWRRCQRC